MTHPPFFTQTPTVLVDYSSGGTVEITIHILPYYVGYVHFLPITRVSHVSDSIQSLMTPYNPITHDSLVIESSHSWLEITYDSSLVIND